MHFQGLLNYKINAGLFQIVLLSSNLSWNDSVLLKTRPETVPSLSTRTQNHHLVAHSVSAFKEDPVALSSRKFSQIQPSSVLKSTCYHFYLPKLISARKHPSYLAHCELCLRYKGVKSIVKWSSIQLWSHRRF